MSQNESVNAVSSTKTGLNVCLYMYTIYKR